MAQYAQQIAAQFPEIVLSINSQVNGTGLVGGLAFSAYTCMPPRFLVVSFVLFSLSFFHCRGAFHSFLMLRAVRPVACGHR